MKVSDVIARLTQAAVAEKQHQSVGSIPGSVSSHTTDVNDTGYKSRLTDQKQGKQSSIDTKIKAINQNRSKEIGAVGKQFLSRNRREVACTEKTNISDNRFMKKTTHSYEKVFMHTSHEFSNQLKEMKSSPLLEKLIDKQACNEGEPSASRECGIFGSDQVNLPPKKPQHCHIQKVTMVNASETETTMKKISPKTPLSLVEIKKVSNKQMDITYEETDSMGKFNIRSRINYFENK